MSICINDACDEGRYENRALTLSVRHAVKEDPVFTVWSVFDEGHVVARLDAEHGEQLQFVPGQSVRYAATQVSFGDVQSSWLMGPTLRMRVYLQGKTNYKGYNS